MTNKERREYIAKVERSMVPEGQTSYEEQLAFKVSVSLSNEELVAFARRSKKDAAEHIDNTEFWNVIEAEAEKVVLKLLEEDVKSGKRKRGIEE